MEASLPISAAIKPGAESKSAARPNANAPSITLPLRFFATGLAAFVCGMIWLIVEPGILAGYHYSPHAVALTHLFVLGWLVSVIMGAVYQLVPVALETELHSERLARWQFAVHLVGFAGMVWMFRSWNMKQVGHFGSVMAFGFSLFVYNIVRTLFRVPRWNVIASAVASALFWISSTAVAGLSIAASKCGYETLQATVSPSALSGLLRAVRASGMFMSHFLPLNAMHAHAHLGIVGFFVILMVGVSYKLIPMFALSEIQSPRRALASVLLLNIGVAATFLSVLLNSTWKSVSAAIIITALGIYGWELAAILRARKRRELDWGLKYFITAVCLLAPVSLIGLYLSRPLPWTAFNSQMENAYGFVALIGVVSFAIVGMLYKIVPFLVWYGAYSKHIGRARVPALAEMYSGRLQCIGFYAYLAGLCVNVLGILTGSEIGVRFGSGLLAVALLTVVINAIKISSHLFRPQLVALSQRTNRSLA